MDFTVEEIATMYRIITKLATGNYIGETMLGDRECCDCFGDPDYTGTEPDGFKHTDGCIITQARAIVAQKEKEKREQH